MAKTVTDRTATRAEVLGERRRLVELAAEHGLGQPRVDGRGTVIVHSNEPGYRQLARYATDAATLVGVWVNVITDDVPAAEVETEAL
ncbi:MAG: hypothetical protein LC792_28150 [Actinobacteria bacterium]|nr:hypothetical protein [Actinomycetota bacterium]